MTPSHGEDQLPVCRGTESGEGERWRQDGNPHSSSDGEFLRNIRICRCRTFTDVWCTAGLAEATCTCTAMNSGGARGGRGRRGGEGGGYINQRLTPFGGETKHVIGGDGSLCCRAIPAGSVQVCEARCNGCSLSREACKDQKQRHTRMNLTGLALPYA